MSNQISAVLIVHNEQERIEATIRDLREHVAEIIVIDQSSSDRTPQILDRLYEDAVIDVYGTHPAHGTPEVSRPEGIAQADCDWVLLIDADEKLTDECKVALPDLLSAEVDVYHLRRLTRVGMQVIEDCPHTRLFRNGFAQAPTFENLGHYAHTTVSVREGARHAAPAFVAILHEKSWDEQAIDNERSDRLMAMRPSDDPNHGAIVGPRSGEVF